jgi:Ca2+-binding RTX toxin-like protein
MRPTLTYAAGAGEANRVTVTVERETVELPDVGDFTELTWLVTETAAPLVAGEGCTSIDPHHASCPAPRSPRDVAVAIALGDGNDWGSAAAACFYIEEPEDGFTSCQTTLRGEAGNDTLFATDDDDVSNDLSGGVGHDTLHGGGYLRGGPGRDRLLGDGYDEGTFAGGPGADIVRGTGGGDTIYGDNPSRGCGIRALARGGGDRLFGGVGPDFIAGCGGNDLVHGGPGRDDLDGSAGADRLVGGRARDDLDAGAGNDTLYARDGRADTLFGWRGTDRARIDRGLDARRSVERLLR